MRPSARPSAEQRQARFQRIYDHLVANPVDRDIARSETSIDLRLLSALDIEPPEPPRSTDELIAAELGIRSHQVVQLCWPYIGNPLYHDLEGRKTVPNEMIADAVFLLAARHGFRITRVPAALSSSN